MKIRRPEQDEIKALSQLDRVRENLIQNKANQAGSQEADRAREGRVELSLSRRIQEELNSEAIEGSNRNRVEMIKAQVANGTYQLPSSDVLAESVAREIGLEILSSRRRGEDDE